MTGKRASMICLRQICGHHPTVFIYGGLSTMSVHLRKDSYQDEGRWICVYSGTDGKYHEKSFGRGAFAEEEVHAFDVAMKTFQGYGFLQPQECMSLLGVTQYTEAEASAVEKALAIHNAGMPQATGMQGDVSTGAGGMTFGQLVDEYVNVLKGNGRSPKHIRNFALALDKLFIKKIGRDRPISDIEYARDIVPVLETITTEKLKKGIRSAKTVNRYMTYLKTIFNYAIEMEYLTRNPMKRWIKRREHRTTVKLDKAGLDKLIATAEALGFPALAWAMEVNYNLGVRPGESELLALKWEDVDFEKKRIHVYGRKTNTYRDVSFNDSFCARLRKMKAIATTPYIIERNGKRVKTFTHSFMKVREKAGLPYNVTRYHIRHLFATTLINNHVPVPVVSKMLGHSKVATTTEIYYECRQDEIDRAADMLPVLNVSA